MLNQFQQAQANSLYLSNFVQEVQLERTAVQRDAVQRSQAYSNDMFQIMSARAHARKARVARARSLKQYTASKNVARQSLMEMIESVWERITLMF